jgi:hypothetical protein
MIRHLLILIVCVNALACIRAKRDECCLSDKLIDPTKKETKEQEMTDFLQRFDVTVKDISQFQTFQRNGCGKLLHVTFVNPVAGRNINTGIEIFVDSTKKYCFPIALGSRPSNKKYISPSQAYKDGQIFKLPLGTGICFKKFCKVSFVITPITSNPIPKGNGRGSFENIQIIWGINEAE